MLFTTGCATLGNDLPSCSNVRGYFHSDVPLGAERTGSRLWIERRLIYTNQIGPVIRTVAAGPADSEWEATRMQAPLLVEDGLWKTTVSTGLERTIRMAALKYRSAPETDWAICPVRLWT
ncbi:MAG: hypothetical protein WD397_06625 [Wenzhouxiangellaceae bacterium]